MEFEIWHIWLMAGIIFFILEIIIPSFVVFNFGVGALFATIGAALGMNLQWQFFIFSSFTLASFFLVRPSLKKWAYKRSDHVKTNTEAFIGKIGVVTEEINIQKNSGRIKIDGDSWLARTSDGSVIEPEKVVKVTSVDSIVLEVEKL